ncbi:MAG TPA: ABC transporter permease [Candidatus Competibacteraceae bacterium]|nr:ABC transporter permease [Candidatus Competibacteraceae bacterium]
MGTFLLRRLLVTLPLLAAISLLVFLLMYWAPGDFLSAARANPEIPQEYIARMEREFGLDRPWYVQYGLWLKNLLPVGWSAQSGWRFGPELGYSWTYKVPVTELLAARVPATLALALAALALSWLIAVPLGVLAAIRKDSWSDRLSGLFAYAALSIPEFFLALLAVFLAARSGWFPTGGLSSIDHDFLGPGGRLLDYAHHLFLPALVLALGNVAGMMRILRANFLDYLRAEFVTTARAKGLPEGVVLFKHVLRNAINPLISAFGLSFAGLLSGALLVENVMAYPGLGQLIFEALLKQDVFVVLAAVLLGSVMLVLGNLLADLLLAWLDPRIRLEGRE